MHTLPLGVTFFERGWLSSNNILIQDENNAILVDSGYWTHAHQTEQLVRQALKNRPLTRIINTHLHSDHCGGNALLQQQYPNIEISIPSGHAYEVDRWDADALTYIPTGQHCPAFSKTNILINGESIKIHDMTWRIHSAPGHDPHSIVLFNEQAKILISADALWENGFGVVFPEIEGKQAFDEVACTLQIIEELKPTLILPGHGRAFEDVSGALARARSRLKQFQSAPEKHAAYAAKVLIKFKLLEVQKISVDDLYIWAKSCKYLQILQHEHAKQMDFKSWFEANYKSLEKSNACKLENRFIINI